MAGCGVVVGLAVALTGRQAVEYTSSDNFCGQACHTAHPHATKMWIASAHYSNKRGIVTHCTDCHLPPEGISYLTEKTRLGVHDLYAQVFHDVSKIDWAEKRRLDHATSFTYDAACVHCHSNLFGEGLSSVSGTLPVAPQQANAEQVLEMRIIARRMEAHLYYQRNRKTLRCINCHLFAGHYIPAQSAPRSPQVETAQFPLAAPGFQSYTEAVPGAGVKFHMIAVEGGTLALGSPTLGACRQHDGVPGASVKIDSFWMGQATVSQSEVDAFLAQSKAQAGMSGQVASAYVDWLSKATGKKYRLPTEAELEYACIAGGTMPRWIQTDSRAHPDASVNMAELNAWGFMDLPDRSVELTADEAQQGLAEYAERSGMTFRVVRVPEKSANSSSAGAVLARAARKGKS